MRDALGFTITVLFLATVIWMQSTPHERREMRQWIKKSTKRSLPVIRSCTDCKHSTVVNLRNYRGNAERACKHPTTKATRSPEEWLTTASRDQTLCKMLTRTDPNTPPSWCPLREEV